MKKILLLALLLSHLAYGQKYPNVRLGQSPASPIGLCEPSITINPQNPANLVAGVILDQVFYSQDSGKTWTRDTLFSPYGVWGDPVVVSDTAGAHYYFHLSDPTGENWAGERILDRIVCQKSTDGGRTWTEGTYLGLNHPKDQDKEWAAVDPENNNLYVAWTQFDDYGSEKPADRSQILLARSTDEAESWSEAQRINQYSGNCLDGDSTTEGAVPSVGPKGEVYVAWALGERIFFDRSLDSGRTWLAQDRVVAAHEGGWEIDIPGLQRCNGMPVTAADRSDGPHRGRVYVNWVDKRRGNYDVWLAYSDDRGDSWSEPLRVNDDQGRADQFLTWLDVDPATGHLYTVFYDRRRHADKQTDVYLAYSRDGGRSWTNERISASPFTPKASVFFGDYNHIDVKKGLVRPIWTRYENDSLSVWTALIQVDQLAPGK